MDIRELRKNVRKEAAKVTASIDKNSCLIYAGVTGTHGHGIFSARDYNGKLHSYKPYRLMYEKYVGKIPDGLVIDHLCRVPQCMNPDHLEPVTNLVNIRRGEVSKKMREQTHCHRNHKLSGSNLYIIKKTGFRMCRECARMRPAIRDLKKFLSVLVLGNTNLFFS